MIRTGTWLALALMVGGCGGSNEGGSSNAAPADAAKQEMGGPQSFDVGEIKSAAGYLEEPQFAQADAKRGRLVFLQCQACHALAASGGHKVGPNLAGMFGQPAASKEGFNYSPALKASGLVWTPKALEEWLIRPSGFVPGNIMAFAGIRDEKDRKDLLAYILTETSKAQ
jgi:cytochrome c